MEGGTMGAGTTSPRVRTSHGDRMHPRRSVTFRVLTLRIYVTMLPCVWDPGKADRNYAKHGVSFEEAATVFEDPLGLDFHDARHSRIEERHRRIAVSDGARPLAVVYTMRTEHGQISYRLISARPASRRERNTYARLSTASGPGS
jgi:uncharacterized protein